MDERRKHPRARLVVKVINRATQEFHYFYSRDVSIGGMFLETREPYPAGTAVELDFVIPLRENKERVVAQGEVVRVVPYDRNQAVEIAAGMGIEFDDTERETFQVIERYVKENPDEMA